jgi:hypothetical protein
MAPNQQCQKCSDVIHVRRCREDGRTVCLLGERIGRIYRRPEQSKSADEWQADRPLRYTCCRSIRSCARRTHCVGPEGLRRVRQWPPSANGEWACRLLHRRHDADHLIRQLAAWHRSYRSVTIFHLRHRFVFAALKRQPRRLRTNARRGKCTLNFWRNGIIYSLGKPIKAYLSIPLSISVGITMGYSFSHCSHRSIKYLHGKINVYVPESGTNLRYTSIVPIVVIGIMPNWPDQLHIRSIGKWYFRTDGGFLFSFSLCSGRRNNRSVFVDIFVQCSSVI